jgi:hypothetical protein
MNKSSNVIDLRSRMSEAQKLNQKLKKTSPESAQQATVSSLASPVLDMVERRQHMITSERRKVRRTILSEFVSAFIVVPRQGLQKVALYDISEKGLAFDLDLNQGSFNSGDEVAMRVYLNHQTYFPFIVRVSNSREIMEEGVNRHGVKFLQGTVNDEALHHFVKFIETVSASLQTDHGDVVVSGLYK